MASSKTRKAVSGHRLSTPGDSLRGESSPSRAVAFTGAEIAAGKEIASLVAKYGPGVGEAISRALKGEEPFLVQLLASSKHGQFFFIDLRLRNVTEHSIYLEGVTINEPSKTHVDILHRRRGPNLSMTSRPEWTDKSNTPFPLLLPAYSEMEQSDEFYLRISETLPLQKRNTVTIELRISQLDKSKERSIMIPVRLRRTDSVE
jgi:hypothetical protein